MIHYVSGNIFDSPTQTLVNPVNTVGVMGKGLALEFRRRYPNMFDEYKKQCRDGWLYVGDLMLWRAKDHFVLNFPTKKHWKEPSSLIYIEAGLLSFANKYESYGISSIAFPKLGCGNGGLDWKAVKPVMERYLQELPIDAYIYV